MKRKKSRFVILCLLLAIGTFFMFQLSVSALSDIYYFSPYCTGSGGATTIGTVSPGSFIVTYTGSSIWTSAQYCNDFYGCFYIVRQPLSNGQYIFDGEWWSLGFVDIWSGWCG